MSHFAKIAGAKWTLLFQWDSASSHWLPVTKSAQLNWPFWSRYDTTSPCNPHITLLTCIFQNPDELAVWQEIFTASVDKPFIRGSFLLPKHMADGRWKINVIDKATDIVLAKRTFEVMQYGKYSWAWLASHGPANGASMSRVINAVRCWSFIVNLKSFEQNLIQAWVRSPSQPYACPVAFPAKALIADHYQRPPAF